MLGFGLLDADGQLDRRSKSDLRKSASSELGERGDLDRVVAASGIGE
ncbi:MAG TPA: hypothetical protein VMH80_22010 [Bryobacteraceae bacterium]|nr:hypothetical protein [Bryobacteraceae bacterium]